MTNNPSNRNGTTLALEFTYHTLPPKERGRLQAHIRRMLAQDPEVVLAYLHGSFTRGGPFRDVDLALLLRSDDPDRAYHYTVRVAAKLEAALGLPVDVQVLNRAPLPFRHHVLTHGILIFSRDDNLRHLLFDITTRMYLDLQAFTRTALKLIRR